MPLVAMPFSISTIVRLRQPKRGFHAFQTAADDHDAPPGLRLASEQRTAGDDLSLVRPGDGRITVGRACGHHHHVGVFPFDQRRVHLGIHAD